MSTLTKQEKQHLQRLLQKRRAVLVDELRVGVQRLRDESSAVADAGVPDQGDLSVADLGATLNAAELAHDAAELHQVELASQRVAGPDFGVCADCDEPIGFPRLSIYPTAQRCTACQEKFEQRHGETHPRSL